MTFVSLVGGLVQPLIELVDELHTSEEERSRIKGELINTQTAILTKALDYEARVAEAKTKVITAEAQAQGWLQRTWRPITMLTFLFLVVFDTFGWTEFRLSSEAWSLLQIGLGGYVVGRSAEKITPRVLDVIKEK